MQILSMSCHVLLPTEIERATQHDVWLETSFPYLRTFMVGHRGCCWRCAILLTICGISLVHTLSALRTSA